MELANLNWAEGFHVRDRACVREWREANDSEIIRWGLNPIPDGSTPLVYQRSVDGGGSVSVVLSGGDSEFGTEDCLVIEVNYHGPDGRMAWFLDDWLDRYRGLRKCRNLISEFEILSLDGSDGNLAMLRFIVRGQGLSLVDSDIPMYTRMDGDVRCDLSHGRLLSSIFPWVA